ncbi:sensor histidine kinase [Puia dinghuensis]|nr:PAS domain S-box protein [Puia dinghuensis]
MDIAPDGVVLSTCARFAALLKKRNIHNFLGTSLLDVFPRLGKTDTPLTPGLFRQGLPGTIDLRVQGPGSKCFIIRWIPTPRYTPAAGGWQLTGLKILAKAFSESTDRRHTFPEMEPSLPESAANLIKQVSDIIVTTDLEDRIIYWNNAAEKFYNIPSHMAIGQSLRQLVHYDYLDTTEDEAYKTLREKGIWEGEASYVSSAGKKSYLICSIRYVRDSNRRITGIMALNRDITEVKLVQQDQQRAEMQLRHYSEQIAGILESITDGFFVLDQHFRVTLWNREAERITRLSAAEILGESIWDKLPELIGTDTWQSFHKAFKKKMTVTFEQYYERTDRWLEMSLYPSDQGVFAYFKEVTLRKKQEALLALEKKVLELNTAKRMNLRALLNYFLKGIQKIFPGMYCCVLTLDEDNLSVRLLSAPGLPAVYAHAIDGLPIGPKAGSSGTAMYRKESVIVPDIATDPLWEEHRDLTLQFGLRACWSIPVINGRDEVLAAFAVYYTTVKSPTEAEMDTFERIANLVAIIIESWKAEEMEEKLLKQELNKQKLIAQAIVDAQEKERAEIGKELHDNINQILSTTKLYLELAKNDNKERMSLINRSAGNIHNAIHEIRNISRSLVPASIGDLGLQDSVADLVESIRTTKAIHVEFYPAGNFDERINDKAKLMLFRIIQEQVNNVLKHSGARNLIIELMLEDAENRIELSITDDGKGFDPGKAGKKGLGLSNIMSRADLFGGTVTIQSAPGRGCKLRVQVPA